MQDISQRPKRAERTPYERIASRIENDWTESDYVTIEKELRVHPLTAEQYDNLEKIITKRYAENQSGDDYDDDQLFRARAELLRFLDGIKSLVKRTKAGYFAAFITNQPH